MFATVSEKGQITLPKKLREQMGIQQGARLDLRLANDGTLVVRLLSRGAGPLFALVARPGEPARSFEEMDEAVSRTVQIRSGPRR